MRTFLIIFNCIVFININVTGQIRFNDSNCIESPYVWTVFDTKDCRNHVDTINQMKSISQIDSSDGNRYLQQFNEGDFHLYYQHDTNEHIMQYQLGITSIYIAFRNNGLIYVMRRADSCKVTEIKYDENGNISQLFYCDYSKPNNCFRKEYYGGKLIDEIFYTPSTFSQPIDSTFLNTFSLVNKVIPLKMIQYDDKGKVVREINLSDLRKSLIKKQ